MLHARKDYNRIVDLDNKIPDDEPVFLLRAQDETAAAVVCYWADLNANRSETLALLAREQADLMDLWPTKKAADL